MHFICNGWKYRKWLTDIWHKCTCTCKFLSVNHTFILCISDWLGGSDQEELGFQWGRSLGGHEFVLWRRYKKYKTKRLGNKENHLFIFMPTRLYKISLMPNFVAHIYVHVWICVGFAIWWLCVQKSLPLQMFMDRCCYCGKRGNSNSVML